jgi:hypothetical protein
MLTQIKTTNAECIVFTAPDDAYDVRIVQENTWNAISYQRKFPMPDEHLTIDVNLFGYAPYKYPVSEEVAREICDVCSKDHYPSTNTWYLGKDNNCYEQANKALTTLLTSHGVDITKNIYLLIKE